MEAIYDNPDGHEWRREEGGVYSVLDHGYLHRIEGWGSDQGIIETARMSTDKGFLGWGPKECPACNGKGGRREFGDEKGGSASWAQCHVCKGTGNVSGDEKLLRYLYEHKHSTPFEFAGLTIEVQAPLMVFREWHRHRTEAYSEMSARYVQMPDLHYVPSVRRIIDSAKKSANKQASGGGALTSFYTSPHPRTQEEIAQDVRQHIKGEQQRVYSFYEDMLSIGVSKEIARLDTPVSRYSRMRATANLRNWLGFLTLRMDPVAQFEICQYAWCVADVIKATFPRTYELFVEGMQPILAPEDVDTPEKAWFRGANHMRSKFHASNRLPDDDYFWGIEVPEYQAP